MTRKQEINQATCVFADMIYSKYEVSAYGIKPSTPLYSADFLEELKLKRDVINNNIVTYMDESNFTYNQITQEQVWTITHDLGHNPRVLTVDNQNKLLEPIVMYTNLNILTLTFNIPTCGKAFLI